jgi:SAM-dependent methyltransferase
LPWPRIKFDSVKLFDLGVRDLLLQDPYYVRLTLERSYPGLGDDFFVGLLGAPDVAAYFAETDRERADWLRDGVARVRGAPPDEIREAEARVVEASYPWNLGMAKAPGIWDGLPWHYWDPAAIYDRVDLDGKAVWDVGAGTGQVAIRCAPYAEVVWALEPVARLRRYIERKMGAAGFTNVRTLAGVLAVAPLEDSSADVAVACGSFGWSPKDELAELERVTRPGGAILMLAPTNYGNEEILSPIRDAGGYEEFEFEVPGDGKKPAFLKRLPR